MKILITVAFILINLIAILLLLLLDAPKAIFYGVGAVIGIINMAVIRETEIE